MRDYARKSPTFWLRGTGKKLRGDKDGLIVADYLTSAPTHNSVGVYSVGLPNICHETGLLVTEVEAAIKRLAGLDFAFYDQVEEVVWVKTMVLWQYGLLNPEEVLGPKDKRSIGIRNDILSAPRHPFVRAFYDHYETRLGLAPRPSWVSRLTPWQAPPSQGGTSTPSEGGSGRPSEGVDDHTNSGAAGHAVPPSGAIAIARAIATAEQEQEQAGGGAADSGLGKSHSEEAKAIADEIRRYPIFDLLEIDRIANEHAGRMLARPQRMALVLEAIGDCAAKLTVGTLLEVKHRTLVGYLRHAGTRERAAVAAGASSGPGVTRAVQPGADVELTAAEVIK